jgi:hypothetical protein
VTEELGFKKSLWQSGAVDRHEWLPRAVTSFMDGTRYKFLADSALARDQDLSVRLGDALYLFLELAKL